MFQAKCEPGRRNLPQAGSYPSTDVVWRLSTTTAAPTRRVGMAGKQVTRRRRDKAGENFRAAVDLEQRNSTEVVGDGA